MDGDGRIHFCKRRDGTSLRVWPSLHELLSEEIVRLNALYDAMGPKIVEHRESLPSY